jgi:hypothetical protein
MNDLERRIRQLLNQLSTGFSNWWNSTAARRTKLGHEVTERASTALTELRDSGAGKRAATAMHDLRESPAGQRTASALHDLRSGNRCARLRRARGVPCRTCAAAAAATAAAAAAVPRPPDLAAATASADRWRNSVARDRDRVGRCTRDR